MKTIPLSAEPREKHGKGSARSTRRAGRIPGVLYGQGENIPLSIDRKDFVRAMAEAHGENIIFDLTIPGQAGIKSLAREIQHHPVSRVTMHVDFQHIDMSKEIHVSVAVHLKGEPEGVRNYGGILEHVTRELQMSCLPSDIPSHIEIDVSELMIGDSVHVSDVPVDKFELLDDPSRVITHVSAPTVEIVAETEEGEEGVEGEAAPEGESDEEKTEDSAEKK